MTSMMIGGVVDEDGELVRGFLVGIEKEASKDSLNSLLMKIAVYGIDGNYDNPGIDLGKASSSSSEF
jgi:hypothetical protein